MPQRFLTTLLVLLGIASAAPARDLQVDVDVLHIGGLLTPDELAALLASPRLDIVAFYHPSRLINGVTARREGVMPFGSRLFAIPQLVTLSGAEVSRRGQGLSFRVAEGHAAHASYRLQSLQLRVPFAAGLGRPQPDLEVVLSNEVPKLGAQERAFLGRYGTFNLGLRVRTRWSDGPEAFTTVAVSPCDNTVQSLGNGQYRFRQSHRLAGLFEHLASVAQSGPPTRPMAGQSFGKLAEPLPAPLTGWQLPRNHIVQMTVAGQAVERLSIYAEQGGPAACRRSRAYEALFVGGQAVVITRSVNENECGPGGDPVSQSVEARWLEDGSLTDYISSSAQGSREWHGFPTVVPAQCGRDGAPPTDEVERLKSEVQRLRAAMLTPAGH